MLPIGIIIFILLNFNILGLDSDKKTDLGDQEIITEDGTIKKCIYGHYELNQEKLPKIEEEVWFCDKYGKVKIEKEEIVKQEESSEEETDFPFLIVIITMIVCGFLVWLNVRRIENGSN